MSTNNFVIAYVNIFYMYLKYVMSYVAFFVVEYLNEIVAINNIIK